MNDTELLNHLLKSIEELKVDVKALADAIAKASTPPPIETASLAPPSRPAIPVAHPKPVIPPAPAAAATKGAVEKKKGHK